MGFQNYFSPLAQAYAAHRPHAPESLFQWIVSQTHSRDCAWDCGTGNGQAAVHLARYFDRVIATDAGARQIERAMAHPKISYRVCLAEDSGIQAHSVNLVTVAQALHWFPFERFYREAVRVAAPRAVIAVWCYQLPLIHPPVDRLIRHFHVHIVGSSWPPERRYVDEGYRTIPFPFEEIPAPVFHAKANWQFSDLLGYVHTWSSVTRHKQQHGEDPLASIHENLARAWGPPETMREIRWPVGMRIGHLKAS